MHPSQCRALSQGAIQLWISKTNKIVPLLRLWLVSFLFLLCLSLDCHAFLEIESAFQHGRVLFVLISFPTRTGFSIYTLPHACTTYNRPLKRSSPFPFIFQFSSLSPILNHTALSMTEQYHGWYVLDFWWARCKTSVKEQWDYCIYKVLTSVPGWLAGWFSWFCRAGKRRGFGLVCVCVCKEILSTE